MPYPNEHACRVRDPGGFQKGSFRRIKRGDLSIIIGRPKGKTTTTAQSYRYPKGGWTASRARAHCKKAGGSFAAATGKKEVSLWRKTELEQSQEGRDKMADELSSRQIRSALNDYLRPPKAPTEVSQPDFYVKDIYSDHAIVEDGGKLFKVPFSIGKDGLEFGKMQEVRIEYVVVEKMKALLRRLLGRDEKAKWTTAYINNLGDPAFLWIEAGGKKDKEGKTTPRSLRHFPVKDDQGKFDLPHVRNAISRIPQAKDKNGKKISAGLATRLQTKARGILERLRKKMPEGFSGFKVLTQEDGSLRWVSWTTNAFQDREEETFSTKSLEDYAVRAMTQDRHGALWIGHFPYGVGTPDSHIVFGRFLVESGPFGDNPTQQKAAAFLAAYEGALEMSPGYRYIEEDREDKVYEWIDIVERSVLPAGTAANLWTSMATIIEEVKAMGMPPEVIQMVKDALGEDVFEEVKADSEALTKALEAAGIDFKGWEGLEPEEGKETPAKKKDEEPAVKVEIEIPEDVKAAFALASKEIDALEVRLKALEGLPKAIEELTAKVDDLAKSDAEKIAEKAKDETPKGVLWRASQDPETIVTKEKEKELEGPKGPPKAVQEMAERIASGV